MDDSEVCSAQSVRSGEHHHNAGNLFEVEAWDEDRTRFSQRLVLRSDSFRPNPLFNTVPSQSWFHGILSPSGAYLYTNRILPAGQRLKLALSPRQEEPLSSTGMP